VAWAARAERAARAASGETAARGRAEEGAAVRAVRRAEPADREVRRTRARTAAVEEDPQDREE
jgi:hypothetical protein